MRRRRRSKTELNLLTWIDSMKHFNGKRINQEFVSINWKRKWKSNRSIKMKSYFDYIKTLLIIILKISLLAGVNCDHRIQLNNDIDNEHLLSFSSSDSSITHYVDGTTPNAANNQNDLHNGLAAKMANDLSNKSQQSLSAPPITTSSSTPPTTAEDFALERASSTTSSTTNRPPVSLVTTDSSSDGSLDDAASQLLGKTNMDAVDYILAADLTSPTNAPELSTTVSNAIAPSNQDETGSVFSSITETNDLDIDHSNPLLTNSPTTAPKNSLDEASLDELSHSDEVSGQLIDNNSPKLTISTDAIGQLIRNRKSSDNSSKPLDSDQQAADLNKTTKAPIAMNTVDKGRSQVSAAISSSGSSSSSSTASPSVNQQVPTFGTIDYDDFDMDYQLKLNTSSGNSLGGDSSFVGPGSQQNLNKRDYDSLSTIKPPNWSALIRQPHVFTSTSASRSVPSQVLNETTTAGNQAQFDQYQQQQQQHHHQAPPMIPALLTVKSTQLTNQELNKVRPQFLLFQDDTPASVYTSDQNQAIANGDLLATASGTGMINAPVNMNASTIADLSTKANGNVNSRNNDEPIISLLNGSPIRTTESTIMNQIGSQETVKPLLSNESRSFSNTDQQQQQQQQQQQVTTIVVDNLAITEAPPASGHTTTLATRVVANPSPGNGGTYNNNSSSSSSLVGRQAGGLSRANQWYNYPHPNLHHNPLLLHHILNKPSVYAQHVGANQPLHSTSPSKDTVNSLHQNSPPSAPASTSTISPSLSVASNYGLLNISASNQGFAGSASTVSGQPPALSNIIEKPSLSGEHSRQPAPINQTQLQMQLNEMRAIAAASSELKQRQANYNGANLFLRPPVAHSITGASSQSTGNLQNTNFKQGHQIKQLAWPPKLNQPIASSALVGQQAHVARNIYQASANPLALPQSLRPTHNHFARFSPQQVSAVQENGGGAYLNPFNGIPLMSGEQRALPLPDQQSQQLISTEFSNDRPQSLVANAGAKIRYPPANFNVMHHLFGNNLRAASNLNHHSLSSSMIRAPPPMMTSTPAKPLVAGDVYQNQLFNEPKVAFPPIPSSHLAVAAKHRPLASFEQNLIRISGESLPPLPMTSAFPAPPHHQSDPNQPGGPNQFASQIIAAPSSLREVYTPRPASMATVNPATPCPQQQQQQQHQKVSSKGSSAEALLKQLNSATPANQAEPSTSNMSEEDMSTYVSQLASLSALQQQQPSNSQQQASSVDQPSWLTRDSSSLLNPGATNTPSLGDSSSLELQVASLLQQLKSLNSSINPISSQNELENLFLHKPSDSLTMNGLQNDNLGQQATSWADLLKHARLIGLPDEVQAQIYRDHLSPLAIEPPPSISTGGSVKHPNGPPYSTLMSMDTLASNKFTVHQPPLESGSADNGGLVWRRPANEMAVAGSAPIAMSTQPDSQNVNQTETTRNVATGLSQETYYSLDGHQRQQKNNRKQQDDELRQRQKQIAFIEALRLSLMRMHNSPSSQMDSTGKNSQQAAAAAASSVSNNQQLSLTKPINNLTLANLIASGQADEFEEQSTNPIPDWFERQLIQESLIHESARVHPFGHTAKATYIGRNPTLIPTSPALLPYLAARPGATIIRPAGSSPHASHLGARPIYPLMPLAQTLAPPPPPPPLPLTHPRIFPNHGPLHHFDGNHLHHHHASPISAIKHLHHHIGHQQQQSPMSSMLSTASQPMSSLHATGPYLGNPMASNLMMAGGNPTRLMLDRFPLASAPAYLIKLPTLTGGTITASGSLLPPTSKLMRARPSSPLRLLNVAASMAPQRMKLVSSMMQTAPSFVHALHQAPPAHHFHHHSPYHGYPRASTSPAISYASMAAMPGPMFAPPPPPLATATTTTTGGQFELDAMRSARPVPIHLHPLHYLASDGAHSHSQLDQINPAQSNLQIVADLFKNQPTSGTSSNVTFAPSNVSLGNQNQQLSSGSLSPSAALMNTFTQVHHASVSPQSSPHQQPVEQYSQNGYFMPSTQQPSSSAHSQAGSANDGLQYSISSGNHQLTLSNSHSPQSTAVNALNRLQQATASLVELTSLASLVEEMVGGPDIESSPTAVLANAISSLTAAQSAALNAQATTNNDGPQTSGEQYLSGGNKPPMAPFSWKNLLAASLWRDKSGKPRDLGALERLVVAARRPNAANLKVKYIRVPVAVYETTTSTGNSGTNGESTGGGGNQLVTKTQLAEILAQNSAHNGGLNFNAQPISSDANLIPASNAATASMATVTPVVHQSATLLAGTPQQPPANSNDNNSNNNNNHQNHHNNNNNNNNNANSISEASSADYLFDELSADSAPHIAFALQDHYLSRPTAPLKEIQNNQVPGRLEYLPMLAGVKPIPVLASKKLVSLGSTGLSPLESALYYTMLDPNASNGAPVETKAPKSSSTEKRRKKKKGKKDEEDDESEDDEDDDDDLLTSNDLPLLESAISTLIHGPPPSQFMQHGGHQNYGYPTMHPSQASWRARGPFGSLRGVASSNVDTYVNPNPNPGGFSLNPFGKHSHRFSLGEMAGAWGARKLISTLLSKRKVSRTSKREVSQNSTTRFRPSATTYNEAKSTSEKPPNLFYTSTEPSSMDQIGEQTTLRYPLISPHDLGIVRSTRKPNRPLNRKFSDLASKPSPISLMSGGSAENFSVQLDPKPASNDGSVSALNITTSKPFTKRLDYHITSSFNEITSESKQVDTEAPVHYDFFLKSIHDSGQQSTTASTIDNSTQLALDSGDHDPLKGRDRERTKKDIMAMPLYHVVADHFSKLHSGSSNPMSLAQKAHYDQQRKAIPSNDKNKKAKKS